MTDKTPHDSEVQHTLDEVGRILTHSKEWYAFFGNKCPVCKVDADVAE